MTFVAITWVASLIETQPVQVFFALVLVLATYRIALIAGSVIGLVLELVLWARDSIASRRADIQRTEVIKASVDASKLKDFAADAVGKFCEAVQSLPTRKRTTRASTAAAAAATS